MLRLDTAPSGVPAERWLDPGPSTQPQIGELWLLSWDGNALALGVISRVASTFVACWPVTLADSPSFAPGVLVEQSPLEVPVIAWPPYETGLGTHMLHRRFGKLFTPTTVSLIDAAFDDDNPSEQPLPLAVPTVQGDEAADASDEMVSLWQSICFNIWPTAVAGESAFNGAALTAAGISPSVLASTLGVGIPAAVGLVRGEQIPTVEQLHELAAVFELEPTDLLESGDDDQVHTLVAPEFKDDYLQVAAGRAISELAARDLVRAEFALAARSSGDPTARLRAVIERLNR